MAWYIDTSAAVKLLVTEEHSATMLAWAGDRWDEIVSSDLTRTEILRAAGRGGPSLLGPALELLDSFELIPVTREAFHQAGLIEPAGLRSLDALHLACALALGRDLDGLVTYDERLADAARHHALPVASPS